MSKESSKDGFLKNVSLKVIQGHSRSKIAVFQNCIGGKFFENFSWVLPRSTHQDASIELLFVKFGSVGASEKKLHSK